MDNALTEVSKLENALAQLQDPTEARALGHSVEIARDIARRLNMDLKERTRLAIVAHKTERWLGEWINDHIPEGGYHDPDGASLQRINVSNKVSQALRKLALLSDREIEDEDWRQCELGKEPTRANLLSLVRGIVQDNEFVDEEDRTDITGTCQLIEGDILKLARHYLALESVDLIVTSPPYNLGEGHWPMGGQGRTPSSVGIGYQDNLDEYEYQAWQLAVIQALYNVAKPGASFFYNHKVRQYKGQMIHPLDWLRLHDNPWTLRQEIIWDRGSTHNHNKYLFWPEDERIYWMTKGKPFISEQGTQSPSVWRFHGPEAGTWHPAPFGEELPLRCIRAVEHDDMIILDPFAGSCTTIKVALDRGHHAIGVDISRDYLNHAIGENKWAITVTTPDIS